MVKNFCTLLRQNEKLQNEKHNSNLPSGSGIAVHASTGALDSPHPLLVDAATEIPYKVAGSRPVSSRLSVSPGVVVFSNESSGPNGLS